MAFPQSAKSLDYGKNFLIYTYTIRKYDYSVPIVYGMCLLEWKISGIVKSLKSIVSGVSGVSVLSNSKTRNEI